MKKLLTRIGSRSPSRARSRTSKLMAARITRFAVLPSTHIRTLLDGIVNSNDASNHEAQDSDQVGL
jgi:hypothetical protein